jgi:hypothetical protein
MLYWAGTDSPSEKARLAEAVVALRTADWLVATAATFTAKLAFDAPDATLTDPGIVTAALFVTRVIPKPPVGAGPLSVMMHVEDPGVTTVAGEQENPVNVGEVDWWIEIVPPTPVAAAPVPVMSTVLAVTCTGTVVAVVPEAELNVAVATTPSLIDMALVPESRQVVAPGALEHEMVFPAAEAALFTTALNPTISACE